MISFRRVFTFGIMYRYGVYDVEQDEGDPQPDFVGKEETYDFSPDLWTDVDDYIRNSKETDSGGR